MALNTKAIKRRIKSITSTRKITKAMEMISAVKMRRAVSNALATRAYTREAWSIINDISKRTDIKAHPLLANRQVKKIGLIIVTGNRGLAGGFTSRLLTETKKYVQETLGGEKIEVELILTGKYGRKAANKVGKTIVAEYQKMDLTTKLAEVLPMAQLAIGEYMKGTYDKIVVAYNHFDSAVQQTPKLRQILPLEKGLDMIEVVNDKEVEKFEFEDEESENKENNSEIPAEMVTTYTFEPGPAQVLNKMLERLVEIQIYQTILESDASEHSARMMAMRNASDAAGDMIKELNYTFNKARQAAITQEISEIVGGAAALG